jgi:hypothetical protein
MKTATKYSKYKDKMVGLKPSVEEIYNQFFMKKVKFISKNIGLVLMHLMRVKYFYIWLN